MWYYNPDIWETVSDWFMVVVIKITAYYLYTKPHRELT